MRKIFKHYNTLKRKRNHVCQNMACHGCTMMLIIINLLCSFRLNTSHHFPLVYTFHMSKTIAWIQIFLKSKHLWTSIELGVESATLTDINTLDIIILLSFIFKILCWEAELSAVHLRASWCSRLWPPYVNCQFCNSCKHLQQRYNAHFTVCYWIFISLSTNPIGLSKKYMN